MRQNRMLEEKTKQRQHTWDHTMGAWWHKHEMAWKRAKEKWLRSFVLFVVPFVCDNVTTSMVPSVGNLVLVFVAKCRVWLVGCLFVGKLSAFVQEVSFSKAVGPCLIVFVSRLDFDYLSLRMSVDSRFASDSYWTDALQTLPIALSFAFSVF